MSRVKYTVDLDVEYFNDVHMFRINNTIFTLNHTNDVLIQLHYIRVNAKSCFFFFFLHRHLTGQVTAARWRQLPTRK